ncbi:MAG: tRNA dihydrouridine synthase DusB [Dehalococcoidia bacterium]|nr:tRNA dihydrouridine synthase DusB [Dehalococcoidia bacterium]
MRIADVAIVGRLRLAPMADVTNAPFRLVARECGSSMTTTEEIDAISLVRGAVRARDIVRHYAGERPLAMQLLGCDADLLCQAAEMVQEAGADIVDLNMGCPMPKITKQGKGAALMRDVPETAQLLRRLRHVVQVPLTVKIRGGWDDEHLNAVEVAKMAEDVGVDAIVVHPRTRSQRFSGRAPWDIIRDVVEAVNVPVTGNGDVTSPAEARAMIEQTGCADVMIGRGAFGRPWVFDEEFECLPAGQQKSRKAAIIERHMALLAEHFEASPRVVLNQTRRHLGWYVENGLPYSNPTRAAIHQAHERGEMLDTFWDWWETLDSGGVDGMAGSASTGV